MGCSQSADPVLPSSAFSTSHSSPAVFPPCPYQHTAASPAAVYCLYCMRAAIAAASPPSACSALCPSLPSSSDSPLVTVEQITSHWSSRLVFEPSASFAFDSVTRSSIALSSRAATEPSRAHSLSLSPSLSSCQPRPHQLVRHKQRFHVDDDGLPPSLALPTLDLSVFHSQLSVLREQRKKGAASSTESSASSPRQQDSDAEDDRSQAETPAEVQKAEDDDVNEVKMEEVIVSSEERQATVLMSAYSGVRRLQLMPSMLQPSIVV